MKQEDKELLLKDLCARLPYGVKCKIYDHNYIICDISFENQNDVFYKSGRRFHIGVIGVEENGRTFYIDVYEKLIKPYLFPLSSMTPKQKAELSMLVADVEDVFKAFLIEIEFYNKNHFDYRSLIPKGLAIDATGLAIYKED